MLISFDADAIFGSSAFFCAKVVCSSVAGRVFAGRSGPDTITRINSPGSIRVLSNVSVTLGVMAGGRVLDRRGERGRVVRRSGSGVPRWNDDNLQE